MRSSWEICAYIISTGPRENLDPRDPVDVLGAPIGYFPPARVKKAIAEPVLPPADYIIRSSTCPFGQTRNNAFYVFLFEYTESIGFGLLSAVKKFVLEAILP
jgi:hypothetical protein